MKKIIIASVALLFLAGCGSHQASNAEKLQQARSAKQVSSRSRAKPAKPANSGAKTLYYHQLTDADRAKVSFNFKATTDSSQAQSGQTGNAPLPFAVDMTVTNKSKHTVKLDESKIVWLVPNQSIDPVQSDKTKVLTVKPKQTTTVTELFADFNNQNLVDAGAFCYLNADYKLAYSYLAYKGAGVSSSNLKDKKLMAMNAAKTSTDSADDAAEATSSSTKDDDTHSQHGNYTSQQLALLAQIYGQQDADDVDVSSVMGSLEGSTISYSADSNTTGHSSVGTALSYEQYSVSGSTLMIMHPAGQGSDAWSGSVDLSDALSTVFAQNKSLANALLTQMQPE